METDDRHLEAVRRLRAVLEGLAAALASAKLDEVLAAEQDLARSLAALPDSGSRPTGDPKRLARELASLRRTLVRCRRLGQTLGGLLRAAASSQGGAGYDHAGLVQAHAAVRVLERRV